MERIKAVAKKEFLHILRDRRTLVLIVIMPLMQLAIYGYAINTDVKHIRTVLFDEDHTSLGRRLVEAFEQSQYFDITKRVQSAGEFRHALDKGTVKAGLHIPPDFMKDLLAGSPAGLQLAIDGTDSNPANVALNTSRAIVQSFMQKERLIPVDVLPIDYRPRLWYNPDLKSAFFMVPGIVGLLIQLLIPMITATAIVREKERGNIEQLLVTPIKPSELMIGKIIPYVLIGLLIAATVIGAARILFQVPVRGNLFTLFSLTFLFLVVCLGFGLFISTIAENQHQASQVIIFCAIPSVLLSGFIFPRDGMPLPIFLIGYAIPLTYFLKIIRGVILKGLGYGDLWDQILPLALMAAAVLYFSTKKFHKRLT